MFTKSFFNPIRSYRTLSDLFYRRSFSFPPISTDNDHSKEYKKKFSLCFLYILKLRQKGIDRMLEKGYIVSASPSPLFLTQIYISSFFPLVVEN